MLNQEQKEKIAGAAKTLVGKPYVYGTGPDKAPNEFDCSSFIQYLYKQVGILLPRSTILQAGDKQGSEIKVSPDYSNFEPGDLLFMRGTQGYYNDNFFPNREICIGHIAVYVGNGEVVHARESVGHVALQKLSDLVSIPKFGIVLAKRY